MADSAGSAGSEALSETHTHSCQHAHNEPTTDKVSSVPLHSEFVAPDDLQCPPSDTPGGRKRFPSRSPSLGGPERKSPRTGVSPTEPHGESKGAGRARAQGTGLSPRSRRKSWRRSVRGRRSLPALPRDSCGLCREISKDLPMKERLSKLMESSVQFALGKMQESLRTREGVDLDALQSGVSSVSEEAHLLSQTLLRDDAAHRDTEKTTPRAPDADMSKVMDRMRSSIQSLTAECAAWESLLQKHRSRAADMARRVEEGRLQGIPLDPACLSESSQSALILRKPDYHGALRRQTPVLQALELLMDGHCRFVRGLLSFQEEAEWTLKHASTQITSSAFQDLERSPVKKLLSVAKS
ncbi:kinetochore-associated protein DSN1 homolog isoform X2 [Amia ocellicauda]|uniref:kinetochore-associated protein DSN1 homolog isoform X2 n=1 Tax=Amia ocellicauda TaxID=2972642 RepID=UPI00346444F0|nr:DSN1 protein [Amia calva]